MFKSLFQICLPLTAGRQCAAMCALGIIASLVPAARFEPARRTLERVLAPGQQALVPGLDAARSVVERAKNMWRQAGQLSWLEARVSELESANRDLQSRLLAATKTAPPADPLLPQNTVEPLLTSSLVEARVLGGQARSYLARRDLLDVGSAHGARPQAFVLATSAAESLLLDAGRDQGLAPHERVLTSVGGVQIVWGKLVDVGRVTSTLRRANDAGYRDLIQLAHPTPDGLRWGPRGMLEGDGGQHCRVSRVAVDHPVDVGDLVFASDRAGLDAVTSDGDPSTDARLFYGSVARIERPAAEPHWKIWVEPAAPAEQQPSQVAVVAMSLNPARVAAQPAISRAIPNPR